MGQTQMGYLNAERARSRLKAFLSILTGTEHRSRRSALLRLAIISSSLSKVCGLALQAIAIPLVYRSLGQHRYELYLLMTAALATIAITQMGAGPGLTQGIVKASAGGRRDQEASLLNAAFRLTTVTALIGGGIVLAALHLIPPSAIFGSAFAGERSAVLSIANVCVFVVIAQIISGVVDSALAGYQEQMFSNIGSMISNILSIGLLLFVCQHSPTISGVIVVLYGVPTLSRVANLFVLYLRRPYLLKGLFQSCRGSYALLLNVGLAFWAIQLASIIEQHGGTYVLAHLSSTQETNLFAIVYKSLSLIGSVNIIITQPLWPAFTDAIAHRDFGWIQRSYAKIRLALTLFSCLVCLLMMTLGPWGFEYFVHVDTSGHWLLFCMLGVYFVANVWTHLYYVTMMGMPGIWRVTMIAFVEKILLIVLSLVLVPRLGAAGMALAYLFASLLLPVWLLPRLMKKTIREISSSSKPAEASQR
jgi:O-antigen/teichoic acid export membrane protein